MVKPKRAALSSFLSASDNCVPKRSARFLRLSSSKDISFEFLFKFDGSSNVILLHVKPEGFTTTLEADGSFDTSSLKAFSVDEDVTSGTVVVTALMEGESFLLMSISLLEEVFASTSEIFSLDISVSFGDSLDSLVVIITLSSS